MGKFNLNSGTIQNHSIKRVTEKSGLVVLNVTVVTDLSTFTFRICSDDREPDLNQIEKDLKQGLATASNTNEDIDFREFSQRNYLYVTLPDGTLKQYTGSKI